MAKIPVKFVFPDHKTRTFKTTVVRLFADKEGWPSGTEALSGNLAHKFLAHFVDEPEAGLVIMVVMDNDLAMRLRDASTELSRLPGGKSENLNPRKAGKAVIILPTGEVVIKKDSDFGPVEVPDELPNLEDIRLGNNQSE